MFLAADESKRTAFHMALRWGQIGLLHKLLEWAKDVLTPEQLQSMFLAADESKRTAWHMALQESQTEVSNKVWDWAKVY